MFGVLVSWTVAKKAASASEYDKSNDHPRPDFK
ncbi:hypothetical protein PR001_g29289 [Phytophthora rubi]|uniref:Uncharacterized protein n=1 Tax=Phytophthora rubi TaxID=129364 RepID=A0A6A3H2I9_9STRA|nr:hypothetical protein PR001_g29289 [Phytophthora rubi]